MRVLDLFCGIGGWSKGFAEVGFDCVGVDIMNFGYPFELILQDVSTIDGRRLKGAFDVIIGSPPCTEFSVAKMSWINHPIHCPKPEEGLKLVNEFMRIISEAQPKLWAMENVRRMEKFYSPKPIWHFMVSKCGRRSLWGNLPLPLLIKDIRFPNRKLEDYVHHHSYKIASAYKSQIPIQIARVIAKICKKALRSKTTGSQHKGDD